MTTNENGDPIDITNFVSWSTVRPGVVDIDSGLALGIARGETTIATSSQKIGADYYVIPGRLDVTVIDPGTFKLSGRIKGDDVVTKWDFITIDVPGATVEVIEGIGAGLIAKSDSQGAYALYGVSGEVQLEVSAAGYLTQRKKLGVKNPSTFDIWLIRRQ